jgi:thiamine-phosphate pyrophosphorylase
MAAQPILLPALYAIFDPEQTRGRPAAAILPVLAAAGVKILQLRAKALAPGDFLKLARSAREITRAHGCRLIINDRVDLAAAARADGVHLGQDDMPLHAARKLLPGQIIGISTHDLEQARAAEQAGADYIGFGPIYGTGTKETGYAPRGLDALAKLRAAVNVPIVAIGGINENNIADVWRAGAASAAMIGDILGAEDIAAKVARILALGSAQNRASKGTA